MDVNDWVKHNDGSIGQIVGIARGASGTLYNVKYLCSNDTYSNPYGSLTAIESPKFKAGDSVRISYMENTFTIVDIEYDSGEWMYYAEDKDRDPEWYSEDRLRATISPTKFQVGDSVIIANRASKHWNMKGLVHRLMNTVSSINEYVIFVDDEYIQFDEQELESSTTKPKSKKEDTMSKAKDQLNANKDAAILAGRLVAGKAINKKLVKLIKPKLPMMVRGYADSPFASLVAANAVGVALKHYAPNNPKAMQAADLMLNAAALELVESFNLDELLDNLLKGVKLPAMEGKNEDED